MKASLKSDLENAFRDVLSRMPSQFTTQEAVQALRAQYPDLWQTSGDALVSELLREIASRLLRRPDIEAVNPDQLQFPEFEHLPRLIRCKGHYIALEDSTLEQLLDFKRWYDSRLAVLLKRTEKFQQTGKELGKLIQLVERFTLTHPGINVRTVFALRTEKQAGRAKLTPEERREIAQQGARGRWGKK